MSEKAEEIISCPRCDLKILELICDIAPHHVGEIDPEVEGMNFGVFSCIHYLETEKACFCGRVFPRELAECPQLVASTISWAFDKKLTPRTRMLALQFLRKHIAIVRLIRPVMVRLGKGEQLEMLAAKFKMNERFE